MNKSRARRFPFAKIVVVLAVVFGIGVGLCGVGATLLARFRNLHEEFGPNTFVGAIGAFALVLSAGGLVCTTTVWAAAALRGLRGKESAPQKLFDREDKTKHDDER